MASLVNQEIAYEAAQVPVAFAAMTPDSTRTVFTAAAKPWSGAVVTSGVEPYVIAPYGMITGGEVTPGAVAGDVAVATGSAMMPGVVGHDANTGVVADITADPELTITLNTAEATPFRIDSVTVNNSGAYILVLGLPHATAFTEARGVAGGPPSIPLASVEVAQIRRNFWHGSVNRAVTAAEIFQVVGTHQERFDYPVWSEDPLRGKITFALALPLIHGATATEVPTAGKLVYVRAATPMYAPINRARDWVPAEEGFTVSSEAFYDGSVGSSSSSLSAATFTCALNDGVTDTLLSKKGQSLIFRFKPDKNKNAYQLTQGIFSVARTFGVGAAAIASVTIAPSQASVDIAA
jgi:hypothetical protein